MVAKNEWSSIGIVGRTGWTTRPVEKRRSAEVIVSIRSSIVRTAFTSASVSSRNRTDTARSSECYSFIQCFA